MAACCAQTSFGQQPFLDVTPDKAYFNTVNLMAAAGITSGCLANYFCRGGATTREQMAVFIIRALFGSDNFTYPQTPYFPDDVNAGYWAFKWIQKLKELGITNGCRQNAFCPGDATSYAAAAVLTVRASQLQPCSTTPYTYCAGSFDDNFADYSQEAYFPDDSPTNPDPLNHFKWVQKVRDQGTIATACGERAFCPSGTLTRGEASYYITRGLLRNYQAIRKVSQNSGGYSEWEPIIVRGSTTWVAGWQEVNNTSGSISCYVSAWNPSLKTWGSRFQIGANCTDLYLTWDPVNGGGRFVFAWLDTGFRNVYVGFSNNDSGTSWTQPSTAALPFSLSTYSWDFPSVAVDGNGVLVVSATNGYRNDLSIYAARSVDGGNTFGLPQRVFNYSNNPNDIYKNLFGRVVGVSDRFHVFALTTDAPQFTPQTLRRLESMDGTSWTDTGFLPTADSLLSPPNNSVTETACTPGTSSNCQYVFFAPVLDAKGDPASARWSVVAPRNYGGRTNSWIWTQSRSYGAVNQGPYDEFLSTTAISSDGSYWASYLTTTPNNSSALSNVISQTIHLTPSTATGATTSTGTAPARWRNMASGRCGTACYAAGDYAVMAADATEIAVPLIGQSPYQRNDLVQLFVQDTSGTYYAPYAVTGSLIADLQNAPLQSEVETQPSAPISSVYDPPATIPVKPIPTNTFRPNFVTYPAGFDFSSLAMPIPPAAYGVPPKPPAVSSGGR
jgi:hypothetical protein